MLGWACRSLSGRSVVFRAGLGWACRSLSGRSVLFSPAGVVVMSCAMINSVPAASPLNLKAESGSNLTHDHRSVEE